MNDNQNENVNIDPNEGENQITLTKEELDKRTQSAADKVRTEYSKKVKELEAQVKALTPPEKSEAEIDFENRLAALEARENRLKMQDALHSKGLDSGLVDYIKSDSDIDKLSEIFDSAVKSAVAERLKDGFKPSEHKSHEGLSKEDFRNMNMDEREQIYRDNPDLFRELSKL